MSSIRRRTTTVLLPALAVLSLAAACGGTPPVTASKDAPIALDSERSTATADEYGGSFDPGSASGSGKGIPGALAPPFTLDKTVWFAGFKIKLTTASMRSDERTFTIEGEAENEGDDQHSLFEDVRIEQDSVAIAEGQIRTEATVLGGGRNAVKVIIRRMPSNFTPDKAVLVLGDAKHQQVRVPLKGQGALVTGEPKVVPSPAPIRVGALVVTTDVLSLRSDSPADHKQAPSESQYVIFDGSVRFDGPVTNVQNQHFSLIPPNGAPQSPKYVNALPRTGSSDDIYAVFTMPTPIGGEYTLRITGDFAYSDRRFSPDEPASTEIKITLPEYPPAANASAAKGS